MITTPAPVGFLDPIPGIIPFGTVTIFASAAGVGKTTMIAEWCARWRDGRTICGHPTNPPTGFYYLSLDRSWKHSTRQLFVNAGVPDIPHYNPFYDPAYNRKLLRNPLFALDVMHALVDKLDPQPGGHLLIDPMAPFFIAGNQNEARPVALALSELHLICDARQINTTALTHFSKQLSDTSQQYRRPQDRISGSYAWIAYSDTQMYLIGKELPERPYYELGLVPRHGDEETHKFVRDGNVFVPYRSLDTVGGLILIPESTYPLFVLIPDGGSKTGELEAAACTMLGISRATFYRHLDKLEARHVISRPYGWIKRIAIDGVRAVPDGESEDKPN